MKFDNELVEKDAELAEAQRLSTGAIRFNHNKRSYLPMQIDEMRSPTVLDLSFNETRFSHDKLSYLTVESGEMRSLTALDLSFNKLYELPHGLGIVIRIK
ncbi:hypothetical protein B0A48_18568 [Cryoendolithus antarcticus]|uniref:Uncharacterized protein n=1 Tax=Cryoendolithus antarcticus TaxID=1507870 RepID=A0A1V8S8V9_9PEZI|nr:hypothetical protein B0A48_18568 [Cryoendolithus antarcticus]